jgi:hypothetical protein
LLEEFLLPPDAALRNWKAYEELKKIAAEFVAAANVVAQASWPRLLA